MTDDDLKAIYAYLRTIPPVTNHVPTQSAPRALVRANEGAAGDAASRQ